MDPEINYGPKFYIGDKVRIRASQQLYWKLGFCTYGAESIFVKNTGIDFIIVAINEIPHIKFPVVLNCHAVGCDNHTTLNAAYVNWALEGDPSSDFARKSGKYKTYLETYPRCKWCHEPIRRRESGEYKGHWEHEAIQGSVTFGAVNYWNCSTNHTIDGEWHVAEHPIEKPYTQKYIILASNRNEAEYPIENEPQMDVLVLPQGRRFKNLS